MNCQVKGIFGMSIVARIQFLLVYLAEFKTYKQYSKSEWHK